MVIELDRLIQSEPDRLGRATWSLWVPPGVTSDLDLRAITVQQTGRHTGHLWEQRDLLRAARGTRLINLGNSGPVLHRDKLVVIHDAAVFRTPKNFSWRYRLAHRAMGRMLARTGRIATVSEFSRRELALVLGLREDAIIVVPNGCDHFVDRERDDSILEKLGLEKGRYFLFVGTPAPNKNLKVLLDAFRTIDRPDAKLVIAGSLDRSVFGGKGAAVSKDVIVAARRNDAEIAALYANATAHVFPSLYEGFGIPPLEAMASGCPVIASDIPVIREVCADAAVYFPPHDAVALSRIMKKFWDQDHETEFMELAQMRLNRFSWQVSAQILAKACSAN
jgi:glycosyltransferase involved in cell wall biosynthesis